MDQKDALVRVGRNLANFQTLEHLLKDLIPTLQVHGTVAEIEENIVRTRKGMKKFGLGELSETFHSKIFKAAPEHELPDEVVEPTFSFNMSIEMEPERVKATRARWHRLVAQRNKLVHSQLMEYDLAKSEDCAQLSKTLDAQNLEICALLDEIASLRSTRAHAAVAMVEHFKAAGLADVQAPPPDGA